MKTQIKWGISLSLLGGLMVLGGLTKNFWFSADSSMLDSISVYFNTALIIGGVLLLIAIIIFAIAGSVTR